MYPGISGIQLAHRVARGWKTLDAHSRKILDCQSEIEKQEYMRKLEAWVEYNKSRGSYTGDGLNHLDSSRSIGNDLLHLFFCLFESSGLLWRHLMLFIVIIVIVFTLIVRFLKIN
jgi:hypothetical protein